MSEAKNIISWRTFLFPFVPILAVYFTSFFLSFDEFFGKTYYGWDAFKMLFEEMCRGNGKTLPVWCANPVFWVGAYLLVFRSPTVSLIAGGLGLAASLLALVPMIHTIGVPRTAKALAELFQFSFDPRTAFGCWIDSMVLLTVVGFLRGIWLMMRLSAAKDSRE